MAEASKATGAAVEGFRITTRLMLSEAEKQYLCRVVNDRFIGVPVVVNDRIGQQEPIMATAPAKEDKRRGVRR